MMRRPIFLAYHTELSILLVAAAAMKVEAAFRLLCGSTHSCCRLVEVVLAGEQKMGGGLTQLCVPLPPFSSSFSSHTQSGEAAEVMEQRRSEVVLLSATTSLVGKH